MTETNTVRQDGDRHHHDAQDIPRSELSLMRSQHGEDQPIPRPRAAPSAASADDLHDGGQGAPRKSASPTAKRASTGWAVRTVAGMMPGRVRSLLRQSGAGEARRSTHHRVHDLPIRDAALVTESIATADISHVEPSQSPLTLTPTSTFDQTWCPCCGRPMGDPMTGLMDRWMWDQRATALLDRFGSDHDPITLLIADLDRFKSINDSAGHLVGDAVLAAVGDVIRSETRSGDLWGRYGSYAGDEFVGLLPGASLPAAVGVAERLQRRVAAMDIPVGTSTAATERIRDLSISIGLATHTPGRSLDDTVERADMALLAAKRNGRDCICVTDVQHRVVVAHTQKHARRRGQRHHEQAC